MEVQDTSKKEGPRQDGWLELMVISKRRDCRGLMRTTQLQEAHIVQHRPT